MADVLILGGSRNLGHITALYLLQAGHHVAVLNRGVTRDELPAEVKRIRATRGDPSLAAAVEGRRFDLVLDMTTYNAADAHEAVGVFRGKAERYVFISSGQVYLVLTGARRPFVEQGYDGEVMSAPAGAKDYDSWKYGVDKRDAEDVFDAAFRNEEFPVTTLRLPMVASPRDHYGRIQGYFARLDDRSPILVPDERGLPIRHVYAFDVARVIGGLINSTAGVGRAYNISQDRSLTLAEYFELLKGVTGIEPSVIRVPRANLEAEGLLPDCSSFSGTWMSELDCSRAKKEILPEGFQFADPSEYLSAILGDYRNRWIPDGILPATYEHRGRELSFLDRVHT